MHERTRAVCTFVRACMSFTLACLCAALSDSMVAHPSTVGGNVFVYEMRAVQALLSEFYVLEERGQHAESARARRTRKGFCQERIEAEAEAGGYAPNASRALTGRNALS